MDDDLATQLRRMGDELRAVTALGLKWSAQDGHPYHAERYQHIRRVAAEVFALADERSAEEIERIVFRELTHVAPVPVVDAAVFDEAGRLLLIQRSDNELWAMPGGALDMGETPSEGAVRECREEAGFVVEPEALIGVYDSRLCGSRSSLQLYQFVFHCRVVEHVTPTTPGEVLAIDWFEEDRVPELSPGHRVRVPDAFRFLRGDGDAFFH